MGVKTVTKSVVNQSTKSVIMKPETEKALPFFIYGLAIGIFTMWLVQAILDTIVKIALIK